MSLSESAVSGRERWRTHFQEQPRSGLSVEAYCRANRLSTSSFYLWRKKLAGAAGDQTASITSVPTSLSTSVPTSATTSTPASATRSAARSTERLTKRSNSVSKRSAMPASAKASAPASATGELLPVRLVQDPLPTYKSAPIEIVIDARTIIRIASGFDPSLLRQVIEVLR